MEKQVGESAKHDNNNNNTTTNSNTMSEHATAAHSNANLQQEQPRVDVQLQHQHHEGPTTDVDTGLFLLTRSQNNTADVMRAELVTACRGLVGAPAAKVAKREKERHDFACAAAGGVEATTAFPKSVSGDEVESTLPYAFAERATGFFEIKAHAEAGAHADAGAEAQDRAEDGLISALPPKVQGLGEDGLISALPRKIQKLGCFRRCCRKVVE